MQISCQTTQLKIEIPCVCKPDVALVSILGRRGTCTLNYVFSPGVSAYLTSAFIHAACTDEGQRYIAKYAKPLHASLPLTTATCKGKFLGNSKKRFPMLLVLPLLTGWHHPCFNEETQSRLSSFKWFTKQHGANNNYISESGLNPFPCPANRHFKWRYFEKDCNLQIVSTMAVLRSTCAYSFTFTFIDTCSVYYLFKWLSLYGHGRRNFLYPWQ